MARKGDKTQTEELWTTMILFRLLICLILFNLPFILFVTASRNKDNALVLLFPLFGTIPAVIGALLLFLPIEIYLSSHALGRWSNIAIPVAGSLFVVIFMLIASIVSGNPLRFFSRLRRDWQQTLGAMLLWSVLGTIWGAVWRLSHWLLVAMNLASND
jgi:hypothetical protein